MERMIATSRLKAFFEQWIEENWEDDGPAKNGRRGIGLLAFRTGLDPRRISVVLNEEVPNVGFDFVDRVLVNLDCIHLWHMGPEHGGFSDYYQDEAPAPAPETPVQSRSRIATNAKKEAKSKPGLTWLDVLHGRALQEA